MPAAILGSAMDRRIAVIIGALSFAGRTIATPSDENAGYPLLGSSAVHKFVNRHSASRLAQPEHACYMFPDSKLTH